jgi:hypothetical protein
MELIRLTDQHFPHLGSLGWISKVEVERNQISESELFTQLISLSNCFRISVWVKEKVFSHLRRKSGPKLLTIDMAQFQRLVFL